MRPEGKILKNHINAAVLYGNHFASRRYLLPVNGNSSSIQGQNSRYNIQQRRFPAPGRPQYADNFALLNGKIDSPEDFFSAKELSYIVYLQYFIHFCSSFFLILPGMKFPCSVPLPGSGTCLRITCEAVATACFCGAVPARTAGGTGRTVGT